MSYYVHGSGLTYGQYLQAQRFVNDVTHKFHMDVASQTRDLIASNASLARQNIELVESVVDGMDRMSFEIVDAIQQLDATFHWGFSQIIAMLGHMNDTLEELVKIAKTPVQTAAYNHYEIARDAFRQELYQECLDELFKAINGDHTSPGYKLDWRFHQMMGTLRLGFAGGDLSLVEISQAEESFLSAARYARRDYPEDAARSYLSAGWALYCQGKFDEALVLTQSAIDLVTDLSEAHFQTVKVWMALDNPSKALDALDVAISLDRRHLLKAAADGDFSRHQEEFDKFVDRLKRSAQATSESKITHAVEAVAFMLRWPFSLAATEDYNGARSTLSKATLSFSDDSYFDYLDAAIFADDSLAHAHSSLEIQIRDAFQSLSEHLNTSVCFVLSNASLYFDKANTMVGVASSFYDKEFRSSNSNFRNLGDKLDKYWRSEIVRFDRTLRRHIHKDSQRSPRNNTRSLIIYSSIVFMVLFAADLFDLTWTYTLISIVPWLGSGLIRVAWGLPYVNEMVDDAVLALLAILVVALPFWLIMIRLWQKQKDSNLDKTKRIYTSLVAQDAFVIPD